LHQVSANGEFGIKCVILRAYAQGATGKIAFPLQIVSGDCDAPAIRAEKTVAHAERGGFARAVWAEQADYFTCVAGQVDVLDDLFAAE
jgi:hypothetical protein